MPDIRTLLPSDVWIEEDDLYLRARGEGMQGQTFSRSAIQGASILTTGVVQASGLVLHKGDRVFNIIAGVSVNGAAGTLTKVGLYDKAGNLLALSADIQAQFNSGATPRAVIGVLSQAYVAPATDLYYAVILSVGGTQPTLLWGVNLSASLFVVGSGQFPHWQTAAADLTATLVPAQTGLAYWFDWS